jgi:ABC-type antimicrobial peptide transport system permease subunit
MTMNGVDNEAFCEELRQMPEVDKVLMNCALGNNVEIKGSDKSSAPIVYRDFTLTENIIVTEGRYPEFENEIMITTKREETEDLHVGDSIVVKGDVGEKSYIITGITTGMNNGGRSVYMTEDGYKRIRPNDRPNIIEITLKNENDRPAFEEKLAALYGASAQDLANGQYAEGSFEERIRAKADEKMALLISQYGVTGADYAIRIGDTMISGNSSHFAIKEMSSMKDLARSQMGSIAAVTKTVSFWAVIFIAVVVAVILGIIAASAVKRQRRELGIMKSMGYTSKDLMLQLTLRILPVTIISSAIAAGLSIKVQRAFWMASFGVNIPEKPALIIGTAAALVLFCLTVTYISAGSIRKISVTELMTE